MKENDRIAALEQKIVELEKRYNKETARLSQAAKDIEGAYCNYLDSHRDEHSHLSRMIYSSFARTHPEAFIDMNKFDEILGKINRDGGDPQL